MFFPFNFYVFIFGCAGSPLLCGLFSRCRDRDCSLVAMRGLLIMVSPLCCGAWPLGGEGNGTPLQYSCRENPMDGGAWWASVCGVAKSRTQLNDFTFTFHFHELKEMATHSSVLAWRISGTGEPGGLPSLGSHRVGHD